MAVDMKVNYPFLCSLSVFAHTYLYTHKKHSRKTVKENICMKDKTLVHAVREKVFTLHFYGFGKQR